MPGITQRDLGVSDDDWRKIAAVVDLDGSGDLRESEVTRALERVDTSGDGQISRAEATRAASSLGLSAAGQAALVRYLCHSPEPVQNGLQFPERPPTPAASQDRAPTPAASPAHPAMDTASRALETIGRGRSQVGPLLYRSLTEPGTVTRADVAAARQSQNEAVDAVFQGLRAVETALAEPGLSPEARSALEEIKLQLEAQKAILRGHERELETVERTVANR